ncbi:InlB B-repeat-containing protein, partial [Candidatus Saccharibacteria bacterium]|nr:InlB B-repeat-containing protein [Candidatus Saccharibacteria bacterium]
HLAGGYGNWFAVGENESNGTIIDSTDEDDPVYCAESDFSYPLPNANCSSSAYNSYQIGFGAKLTSSLPAGTYTNNVVFSAVAKSEGTKYTMNFNANGGTNTMGPRTVLSGSNIVMPKTGFTKDGYGIKGWAMVNNATTSTTPIFLAGQTVAINDLIAAAQTAGQSPATTNSFTVYAVWDIPYTIAFNKNSNDATGSMPSQTTFQTNSTYTIPSTSFEREGYNFTGWALSASGSVVYSPADTPTVSSLISAAQTAGQSVTPGTAGTITLYAIWEVAGPQPCSSTNPISDANGCILADGNAYIYGNSGNTLGWWSLCDSNDSCDSNTYCPAGYTVPTSSTLDTLISNYSGGGLYTALNLSSNRTFWSSTHTAYYQRNAYSMQVSSSSASSSVNDKNDLLYLLCFKSI